MTFLYSCRHAGDQYRITKMDHNSDVESSYLCTMTECQCPAFERRKRCRHLEMLPKFIARGAIDTGWVFDYDRGGWVDNRTHDEVVEAAMPGPLEPASEAEGNSREPAVGAAGATFGGFEPLPAPAKSKPFRRF